MERLPKQSGLLLYLPVDGEVLLKGLTSDIKITIVINKEKNDNRYHLIEGITINPKFIEQEGRARNARGYQPIGGEFSPDQISAH
jgi:hypothetical protein